MTYFAYGSNMLTERLKQRISNVQSLGVARAFGRRLCFQKRSSDGSGKCDIPLTNNSSDVVYGVIFDVPESHILKLDEAEGVGHGYERTTINVLPADGVLILATAYLATADAIDSKLVPYDWYHRLIIAGARQHELPPSYISMLESIESIPDPNLNRKTRLEALQALKLANILAPNSGFGVTSEDIRAYDWQAIMDETQWRECQGYYEVLAGKAASLEKSGDDRGRRVFRLLAAVASYWPNYDSTESPYQPVINMGGKRSPIPEELTSADLDALAGVLNEIRDAEFRARVADVLWVCRKDYKAAQIAVDAYIASSLVLEKKDLWPPFAERLLRARQIGGKLGRLKAFHQKAIQAIEDAISRHEANENGLLCARLMHILLADGVGDPKRYALLAESLAQKMEAVPNWHFACDYWHLKGGWNAKDGKYEDARAAQLKIANTYVKVAEDFTTAATPSFLGASHWMAKTVHALREAKAEGAEIEKAHQRLLEFQKRGMSEMETIRIPREGSDIESKLEQSAQAAVALVKGQCFEDAILRLAYIADPSRPAELRKRIEDNKTGGVFTEIFGASTVRSDGQIADTKPPLASDDPREREEAIVKEMYSQARTIDWPTRVQFLVEPARQQVIAEHAARRVELMFLIQDNPFVPIGREGLFLRGLHAGLHGDVVLALHLLLPQVENSIREIFTAKGVITSKLESDATQDERDLGWMLVHPEMAKIFGEGMAFDLRGLLVERFGLNLRNDIAHGLLDESQMITPGAIYAWWLVLRLCCIPIALEKRGQF